MNQFAMIMRYVKKYNFWGICIVALLLVIGIWWTTTSSLSSSFSTRVGELQSVQQSMGTLSSAVNPANDKILRIISTQTKKLSDDIKNEWNYLHAQQNELNKWPDFAQDLEKLSENNIPFSDKQCEIYSTRIGNLFMDQAATLDLRRPEKVVPKEGASTLEGVDAPTAAPTAAAPKRSGSKKSTTDLMSSNVTMIGVVAWDEKDLEDIVANHFYWEKTPKTSQVQMAQEDFQVYCMLIKAIKQLNEGVQSQYKATVKSITSIKVAQSASEMFIERLQKGRFLDEDAFEKTIPVEATPGEFLDSSPSNEESTEGDEEGSKLDRRFVALYNDRYVDANGVPLTARQYKDSMDKQLFRRLPVYLNLHIEQSHLSDLILNLVNANMSVEVKSVVINPGKAWQPNFDFGRFAEDDLESGASATRTRTGRTPDVYSNRNNGKMMESRTVRQGPSSRSSGSLGEIGVGNGLTPNDIEVEIYGVISLLNPYNPDKVRLTDAEATDGEATDAEATDGEATDGEATDGEATDEEATDGKATDGEATDGEATDGEATGGEATDGEATDGKAVNRTRIKSTSHEATEENAASDEAATDESQPADAPEDSPADKKKPAEE